MKLSSLESHFLFDKRAIMCFRMLGPAITFMVGVTSSSSCLFPPPNSTGVNEYHLKNAASHHFILNNFLDEQQSCGSHNHTT